MWSALMMFSPRVLLFNCSMYLDFPLAERPVIIFTSLKDLKRPMIISFILLFQQNQLKLQMSKQNSSVFSMLRQKHYQGEDEHPVPGSSFSLDSEMQGLISKLNKKSEKTLQTRIVAFQKILEKLKDQSSEYIEHFMKLFLMVFDFVTFAEKNKNILVTNQQVVRLLMDQTPKQLKKNFKSIFPLMFFTCFHQNEEVAHLARENLGTLIKSKENMAKAFCFHFEDFVKKMHPFLHEGHEYMKEISIYQNEETDKMIFNNNRSALFRAIAEAFDLSVHFEENKRKEIVAEIAQFIGLPNKNKKKTPLVFQIFSESNFDYLLKSAIARIFSKILSSGNEEVLQNDIPQVLQFFLIQNIAEPTPQVQKEYWQEKLVLNLLAIAQKKKFSLSEMETNFANVISNYGFGVGSCYYEQLPQTLMFLFHQKNWKNVKQKLLSLLQVHFRVLCANNQQIDVDIHVKTAFQVLLEFNRNESFPEEERKDIPDQVFPDLLLFCVEQFLQENNPKQRNLLVLNVNNNKKLPLLLIQFLSSSLSQVISQVNDTFLARLGNWIEENFLGILQSELLTSNFSILLFYWILHCENNPKLQQFLLSQLQRILDFFRTHLEGVKDSNFDQKGVFNSLFLLLSEIFTTKLKATVLKVPCILEKFSSISQELQDFFKDFVVDKKLSNQIQLPHNYVKISFILSQIVRLTVTYRAPIEILELLNSKISEDSIALNQSTVEAVFIFLTRIQNLKTIEQITRDKNLDAVLIQCQTAVPTNENKDFFDLFSQKPEGVKLLQKISHLVLEKNILSWTPLVTDAMATQKELTDFLIDLWVERVNKHATENTVKITLVLLKKGISSCSEEMKGRLTVGLNEFFKVNRDLYLQGVLSVFESFKVELKTELFKSLAKDVFTKKLNRDFLEFLIEFVEEFFEQKQDSNSREISQFLLKLFIQQEKQDSENSQLFKRLISPVFDEQNLSDFFAQLISSRNPSACLLYEEPYFTENLMNVSKNNFWVQRVKKILRETLDGYLEEEDNFEHFKWFLEDLCGKSRESQQSLSFLFQLIKLFSNKSEIEQEKKVEYIELVIRKMISTEHSCFLNFLHFEQIFDEIPDFVLPELWSRITEIKEAKEITYFSSELFSLQYYFISNTRKLSNFKEEEKTQEQLEGQVQQRLQTLMKIELGVFEQTYAFMKVLEFILVKNYQNLIALKIEEISANFEKILAQAQNKFAAEFSFNCFYQLLRLLKRLINILEIFPESLQKNLFSKIVNITLEVIENLEKFEGEKMNIDQFLIECSEIITRFALQDESKSMDVNGIIKMTKLKINSLKKSSFFLLQSIQEVFNIEEETIGRLVQQQTDQHTGGDAMELIAKMPEQIQLLLTNPEQFSDLTYFLIVKNLFGKMLGFSELNQRNYKIMLFVFESEKIIYHKMLDKILAFFYNKKYNQSEYRERIQKTNLMQPEQQWEDFITESLEESFAFSLVFYFLSCFSKQYREWCDNKTKLTKLSGMIIQSGLEDKILDYQLDQIELTQHEWKSDNFNIHLDRKNREVVLIYTVDEVNIEFILKIPDDYPKQSLMISANGKYTKLNKMKLLMIRILNDKSLNLISGLMKWKSNTDLHFQGIEPCTICYYILEQKTSKLPSEQCQTCKNKYHKKCINHWFTEAGKTECPLCKSGFYNQ